MGKKLCVPIWLWLVGLTNGLCLLPDAPDGPQCVPTPTFPLGLSSFSVNGTLVDGGVDGCTTLPALPEPAYLLVRAAGCSMESKLLTCQQTPSCQVCPYSSKTLLPEETKRLIVPFHPGSSGPELLGSGDRVR